MHARLTPDGSSPRRAPWAVVGVGALVLVPLAAALAQLDPGAACAVPALALALLLATRRYPGERMLVALAGGSRRERPRPRPLRPRVQRLEALLPRGGELLASSLAVRPPPAPAAAG